MRSGVTQPQSNERERSSHGQISVDVASDEIVNITVEMKNGIPVITTTGFHYHKGKINKRTIYQLWVEIQFLSWLIVIQLRVKRFLLVTN